MSLIRASAAAFACLCTLAACAQSGNPAPMTPLPPNPRLDAVYAQMGRVTAPGQVALSPDGALLAYTLRGNEGIALHVTEAANPDPAKEELITPGSGTACSNTAPVWSPDSATLAFTSTCTGTQAKPDQEQIFLWSKSTGKVRQLTHVKGLFQQAAWSPDGRAIAFLFVENATRSAGALAAMKPWSGVIGEDGIEVQRVYGVRADSAEGFWMTPANLHVFEFNWAPSSRGIAFVAANPPGENNWWVAKLYTRDVESGTYATGRLCPLQGECLNLKAVFDPVTTTSALRNLQIAVPRFSPDGKHIAFIGGLMSDQGSTGGDIWVIDTNGQHLTDITPNIDGTPTWLTWTDDHTVGFSEDRRGHSLIAAVDFHGHSPIVTDLGEVNITGGPIKMAVSLSQSTGTIAFVKSGHDAPPEIWAGQPAALKQITHLNDAAKPMNKVESVEWVNEGFHVQGWLVYPVDYDPVKKYPLLVTVHGGPSASASSRWGGSIWAGLGYFEFQPNPRGSFGQGEKFTAANIKDFGYGDLRDILAGMDAIEARLPIDKSREFLNGWSYGGFMTMFGVTQTTRFRAAVAGAGISDWESYYGENSIDQWMLPFFGATVYDDPAVYAKSSAINFIHQAKTPTLILVGDRDGECPAPQSFEFWHALRAAGVKTQLVVYPNEGHGFVDPAHIRDRNQRMVEWFEKQGVGNRE
jgi:dipeptidyl aminopeptidase/acylaminoacyl peptidase